MCWGRGVSLNRESGGRPSSLRLLRADLLSSEALELFCCLPITCLTISPPSSNISSTTSSPLAASDLLLPLSSPNSFLSLISLSLASLSLPDHALHLLRHLPLEQLNLNDTGIGIEGVANLVPLAASLKRLHLANDPQIDDDCLPLLALLTSLQSLDLSGTSTTVQGLRAFVCSGSALNQLAPPLPVAAWVVRPLLLPFLFLPIADIFTPGDVGHPPSALRRGVLRPRTRSHPLCCEFSGELQSLGCQGVCEDEVGEGSSSQGFLGSPVSEGKSAEKGGEES